MWDITLTFAPSPLARIYTRQEAKFADDSLWPEQFEWLRQRLEKMHKVLGPIVKAIASSNELVTAPEA
jgi:hypothetical protein